MDGNELLRGQAKWADVRVVPNGRGGLAIALILDSPYEDEDYADWIADELTAKVFAAMAGAGVALKELKSFDRLRRRLQPVRIALSRVGFPDEQIEEAIQAAGSASVPPPQAQAAPADIV
jgi:hypothetical protein